MDQKQIREEIEKLIKKSYKEIDKVFAERLKEILNQIKKLLMKIEGKDPHIGWTEVNKFRRLDSELKRIEKDLEGDHKKIAENINNLKEKTYLDTFLKHTYLFEQAAKDRFLTAIPNMKLVRKMLDQPIKFIKLDESLKKERKRALKRIRADITLGVLNGEGFKKIAKRLRTSLGMTVKQSKRVARTEGGRAMEQAAFDSAQVAKKYGARMHKIWETTLDLRTRPSHQVLDHQMKDIDEPFEINGCKGMHPKGFVGPGSAGENINCRCTVIYSINGILPDTRRAKINKKGSYQVPYQSYTEWLKSLKQKELNERLEQAKKFGKKIYITDQAIDKVEKVKIPNYTEIENDNIHLMHQQLLKFSKEYNNSNEVAYILVKGKPIIVKGEKDEVNLNSNPDAVRALLENTNITLLHNHPGQSGFSLNDIRLFLQTDSIKTLTIVTNKGRVKYLTKTDDYDYFKALDVLRKNNLNAKNIDKPLKALYDVGVESKLR